MYATLIRNIVRMQTYFYFGYALFILSCIAGRILWASALVKGWNLQKDWQSHPTGMGSAVLAMFLSSSLQCTCMNFHFGRMGLFWQVVVVLKAMCLGMFTTLDFWTSLCLWTLHLLKKVHSCTLYKTNITDLKPQLWWWRWNAHLSQA